MSENTLPKREAQQQPSIGRVVHYVMSNGKHRPATIVEVWPGEMVNLQVLVDGPNDYVLDDPNRNYSSPASLWRGSVHHDETQAVGTWHWPEYVPPVSA